MWRFDSDTDPGYWVRVDSPTNVTLRDLTATNNGPVAVGDKGVAIGRGRERWGIILENGPGAKGRALYAVDSTDDGERVWFAGAGGAFGYYDIVDDERRDYSVPRGNSNSFYSLAVAGERGSEKFLVGDGSGNVLPGHVENDKTDWSWATTPSSGNAVEALAHDDDGFGYAVTPSADVFYTTKDEEWECLGIDGAQNSLYDCAFDDGVFVTGGGGGVLYEAEQLLDHDDEVVWTPRNLGGFAIYGVEAGHGAQLACGEGGNIHIRMAGGDWEQGHYPKTTTLRAGLVDKQMVAVGANGLVVERREREDLTAAQRELFGLPVAGTPASDSEEETEGADDDSSPSPESGNSSTELEWVEGGVESGSNDAGGSENDSGPDAGGSGDDDEQSGWAREEPSADGDEFDGRGENYDGDANPPAAIDDRSTGEVDSGNDPADEPDEADNDEADAPDEADADTDADSDDADAADTADED